MLKSLLLFLLLQPFLLGFELTVNTGEEDYKKFSILHLRETIPVACKEEKDQYGVVLEVLCVFPRKPEESFRPLNSNFFIVRSFVHDKQFVISIKPHKKIKLIPVLFDLSQEDTVYMPTPDVSKHWMVVGYEKKFPLISYDKTPPHGLNLPVFMPLEKLPYVGALDFHGNPVKLAKTNDIPQYLEAKKLFQSGDCEKVIELVNVILESHPDTVFSNELLLFNFQCQHKLKMWEDIIYTGKLFLRMFSADPKVPMALAYIAQAYTEMGMYNESDYFFQRLFSEFPGSYYEKLGFLYKGAQLEIMGKPNEAIKWYLKALTETKDRELASLASMHIAGFYIDRNKMKPAKEYISKVLNGNPKFFTYDRERSLKLAEEFGERGMHTEAAKIYEAMIIGMTKDDEYYQEWLRNAAMEWSETNDTEKAYEMLSRYLKEFPYGMYSDEIAKARDGLFFHESDLNITAQIEDYDKLIEKYGNEYIGKNALVKKAELYFDNERYQDVLDMENELQRIDYTVYPEAENLVRLSAIELAKTDLQQRDCYRALELIKNYEANLSNEFDPYIFDCAIELGKYQLATTVADGYIHDKNINIRLDWLGKLLEIDVKTGKYNDVIKIAKEIKTLDDDGSYTYYNKVVRYQFDAYAALGDEEGMIRTITYIEDTFGLKFKDIERYVQMVDMGVANNDDVIIENFAKKVIKLQNDTKTYTQTPYIEFALAQVYIDRNEVQKALDVFEGINKEALSPDQKARVFYQIGSLNLGMNKKTEALKAFEESVSADANSSWGKLSNDSIPLTK